MGLITVLLILGMSIGFANDTYSQSTKIDLNIENKTIKDVFDEIEQNSEYIFLYNNATLDTERVVSISSKGETIYEIMDKLFKGTDNTYRVSDRQVYISKEESAKDVVTDSDAKGTDQQKKTLTGSVVDENGEPIIGASVVDKDNPSHGTITDIDGNFRITDIADNTTLRVSYVGMRQQDVKVGKNTNITITLVADTELLDEVVVVGYGTQ
ncbi:MAG: carboxypeptidase-like regulatory domain-containing protein, partial [Fermentimonas sp.]